jgi:ATP-dependent Clp protease adaptor protein ClpS
MIDSVQHQGLSLQQPFPLSPRSAKVLRNATRQPEGPVDPGSNEPSGPTAVLEKQEERLKPPPMFAVYILNDDYTPMEFVVLVLQKFFGMGREKATQVMLKVHREGRGVCGVFPKDVASTKVEQVAQFSKQQQHPLQCVMEEA